MVNAIVDLEPMMILGIHIVLVAIIVVLPVLGGQTGHVLHALKVDN